MASVYKRTWAGADGKKRVRWVAAYKDQHGKRHNKGFLARKDAKAFLVMTEGEIVRGIHTPEHASITVRPRLICGCGAANWRTSNARPCGNTGTTSRGTSCR